jgi:hypothetical protein
MLVPVPLPLELTIGGVEMERFEAPGVEPVFPEKPQAINYARSRATFRSGEIRVLDSTGKLERMIAFTEAGRNL